MAMISLKTSVWGNRSVLHFSSVLTESAEVAIMAFLQNPVSTSEKECISHDNNMLNPTVQSKKG